MDRQDSVEFPESYDKTDSNHENGVERDNGRWATGQSGNPNGRPEGTGPRQRFKNLLESHGEELIMETITRAKGGDNTALRMCMDRLLPALKAVEVGGSKSEDVIPLVIETT